MEEGEIPSIPLWERGKKNPPESPFKKGGSGWDRGEWVC